MEKTVIIVIRNENLFSLIALAPCYGHPRHSEAPTRLVWRRKDRGFNHSEWQKRSNTPFTAPLTTTASETVEDEEQTTGSLTDPVAGVGLDHRVVTLTQEASRWVQSPTGRAFRLLQVQHSYSPVKSLKYCQRVCIPNTDPSYDHTGIKGLISCSNSLCTVCGKRKEEQNASILENVIKNTRGEFDYFIGTLTFSTDCPIEEQASAMQLAYSKWIQNVRRKAKYIGSNVEVSWSNDITVDTRTGKCHLHRHFIARVPKAAPFDCPTVMFSTWQSTVRRHTDRNALAAGFYCEPISESGAAIRYLYKTVREATVHSGKSVHQGNRVSWYGLIDLIHSGKEELVSIYRRVVTAMKGKRWHNLSLGMKADYQEEEITKLENLEEERVITKIEGTPQIHSAICHAGALVTLRCVLATNRDGDKDIEAFRTLVDKWKPILHRNNRDTKLQDEAIVEFYKWAEGTGVGVI